MLALLFGLLNWGRPNVSVAVALDLSSSTYGNQSFNAPGTIMRQQVDAVHTYLAANALLKRPNQIQIFGFGGSVQPLTQTFQTDAVRIKTELEQKLNTPGLNQQIIPNQTNVTAALQASHQVLKQVLQGCKEVLIVTDGTGQDINAEAIQAAIADQIRMNVLLVANDPALDSRQLNLTVAAARTGGILLLGQAGNFSQLLSDRFFSRFNSNLKWIIFWLGMSWVAMMWLVVLPLDRWILQGQMKLPMNLSGQIALGHALFWSVLTPILLWSLSGLPLISPCS